MSSKSNIEAKVSANKVVVYSKTYCPYCTKTKSLLNSLGVDYSLVELDNLNDGDDQQDALNEITGQRSVPNTFIGGKSVGGNSDIQALHKSGKLVPLLKEVGAIA